MSVELDYAVPAADLADYVTLFYHFRADVPAFEDIERADHAQLRFRLSWGGGDYRFADGSVHAARSHHVIGPTIGSTRTRAAGPVEVVGMGITPAGWAAMVGSDASTMTNRAVDATEMFEGVDQAAAAMRAAPTTAAKVAIAADFVRALVAGGDRAALRFARHVDSWLAGQPSPALEDLEAATGLSRRQVERRCKAIYGAPPKLLARKYRALRAAVAMVSNGESVGDLLARGFYDQSHLIREIRQFTGLTPRQLKANPTILSQLTIGRRSALGGQVIPLISAT